MKRFFTIFTTLFLSITLLTSCSIKTSILDFTEDLIGTWTRTIKPSKTEYIDKIIFEENNEFCNQKIEKDKVLTEAKGHFYLYQTNPHLISNDPFYAYKIFLLVVKLTDDKNERHYGVSFSKEGKLLLKTEMNSKENECFVFSPEDEQED